ncbi:MAG: hypothetical protein KDD40_12290 [Bdellovibrionales bacterium]|nr:hypothetical protein [Bdellovibrionales bacterium]
MFTTPFKSGSLPLSLILLLLISLSGWQMCFAITLPSGLTSIERKKIVKQLGIPTSSKFLSNPYPLGGYVGIEFGVSYHLLDINDISLLGNQVTNNDSDLSILELSFGKGLYNNVDVFFHFAPFNTNDRVNSYGGILKWCFYEAKFLPINFSILTIGSVFHVSDSFVNQTLGLEFMTGINVDNLSIYFGAGQLSGEGHFIGGANGVVDNNETTKEEEKISHLFLGLNFDLANFFISAQMDRYTEPIFSAKLGMRY